MKEAIILHGATDLGPPHFSADLLWRTGFRTPDPFSLVEIDGKTYLILSPLEVERAEKEAGVDYVVSLFELMEKAEEKSEAGAVIYFLEDKGVTKVNLPRFFPYAFAKRLEEKFRVELVHPVYPMRALKTEWEILEIEKAQRAVEHATGVARDFLVNCKIIGDKVFSDEVVVTSEIVRSLIDKDLFNQGYLGIDTVVSSGLQAADPHCLGSGPVIPYSPIVMDIFPLSLSTHYYTDQTRTFFKGEPSPELRKMYTTVLEAQELSMAMLKAGVDGKKIYEATKEYFEKQKYPTNFSRRPMEGFIHGVGHGVGIDIHEAPRIGGVSEMLDEHNVVTVEPGLYYFAPRGHIPAGGIRIEDILVVEKRGARNLTRVPKDLNWAIL